MEFFKNIYKSVYGPEFYHELLAKPFSYSLKYFALFSLLITIIATIYLSFLALPKIDAFLQGVAPAILDYFPDELEIVIKNGAASTNVPEPYFLKFPFDVPVNINPEINGPEIENLLVIDTRVDQASLEEFKAYKTAALLNRKTLMNYDQDQITIQSLEDIPDFTINKGLVSSLIAKIIPYFRFAGPLFTIVVFGGYFCAVFFGKMFYLLFVALFIWIIARVKKVNVGYKKSYQLGLHLFTAGILYETIFIVIISRNIIAVPLIPFLFSGLTLVLTAVNLRPSMALIETPPKERQAQPPAV